jgi:hypothetical protein
MDFAELYVIVQNLLELRQLQPAQQELPVAHYSRTSSEASDRCIACTAELSIRPPSPSRLSSQVPRGTDIIMPSPAKSPFCSAILSDVDEARVAVQFRCGHSLCQTCFCLGQWQGRALCATPDEDCAFCSRGELSALVTASDLESKGIRRFRGTLYQFLHNVFSQENSQESPETKRQAHSTRRPATKIDFVMEDRSCPSEIAVG